MSNKEKKARNSENIKQVVDVLIEAGYRCGRVYGMGNMRNGGVALKLQGYIEMWTGPGSVPVVALQFHGNDDGFECYVPVSQSIRMDETLTALRAVVGTGPKL